MAEELDKEKERVALAEELLQDSDFVKELMHGVLKLPPKEQANFFKKAVRSPVNLSQSTYYKAKYALQLIPDLQEMVKSRCHLVYDYASFPAWSQKTLYLYVNDSFRYAAEFMDSEDKWISKLRDQVQVCADSDAVRIIFKDKTEVMLRARRVNPEDDLRPNKAANHIVMTDWKHEMHEWMEKAKKGEVFERVNVLLSDEDAADLLALFDDDNFGLFIAKDKRSFKIRKLQ